MHCPFTPLPGALELLNSIVSCRARRQGLLSLWGGEEAPEAFS